MVIYFEPKAVRELKVFPRKVQVKFQFLIESLESNVKLPITKFKKLVGYELYELRVKDNRNNYRALLGIYGEGKVILIAFIKKTRKTPKNKINIALKRLLNLE